MWIQKKDGSGCDILCDMCGEEAKFRVMTANCITAEVCEKGVTKLRALIESQLKTRPQNMASPAGFILDPLGQPTEVNIVDLFRKKEEERAPETVREL